MKDLSLLKGRFAMRIWGFLLVLLLSLSLPLYGSEGWFVDLEVGMAFPGYNDVQVPNDSTGTRFSISETLDVGSKAVFRGRLGYETGNNTFSVFAAPLQLEGTGTLPTDLMFAGESFSSGENVDALYRFDSYRLTWRYTLKNRSDFLFKLGLTAKIRDAEIRIESEQKTASTANTGFVPLLSFELKWKPSESFAILLDGDALVGPVGRAEDVFLGAEFALSEKLNLRTGYRVVEGGADVESVYNFTLVNYATAGVMLFF